jgi:MFS family permease
MQNNDQPKTITFFACIVLSVASLLYGYEFFIRVAPSVLTQELMQSLNIDASFLSLLVAAFFYGYTPMQIPAGMLGDRFGPKKVLISAMLTVACMTIVFALSNTLWLSALCRFLTGIAASFAYIGPIMLAAAWAPVKRFALITGLIQAMGSLGAIISEKPLSILNQIFGLKTALTGIGIIGLLIALLFYLVIEDAPAKQQKLSTKQKEPIKAKKALSILFGFKPTWAIAGLGFCCWGPMSVFSELWGVSFLDSHYHFTIIEAASMMTWTWVGVAVASPFWGWCSDYIGKRLMPLNIAFSLGFVVSCWMIYLPPNSALLLKLLLFLFGFACGSQSITFGLVRDLQPQQIIGSAIGVNNMAVITGGIVLQPLAGFLLKWNWAGHTYHGAPIYQEHAFAIAFSMIPICFLIGLLLSLVAINETHCQQTKRALCKI